MYVLIIIQLKDNQAEKFMNTESIFANYIETMRKLNNEESDINDTKDIFLSVIKPLISKDLVIKICDSNYSIYI